MVIPSNTAEQTEFLRELKNKIVSSYYVAPSFMKREDDEI